MNLVITHTNLQTIIRVMHMHEHNYLKVAFALMQCIAQSPAFQVSTRDLQIRRH